jgi:hypothetical protein
MKFDTGIIGESGNCRQFAVNIAAPRFHYRENLPQSPRGDCAAFRKKDKSACVSTGES